MKRFISFICLIFCTLIWGTTFIAQDTGMDNIGPFTFNASRFFVAFFVIVPFVLIFEKEKILKYVKPKKADFIRLMIPVGLSLFFGSQLQQVSLIYTDVANSAFFTIFYVPLVPILIYFLFSEKPHWSVWPSVFACVIGGYFLSDFSNADVRLGDSIVLLGAVFWALHIIYIGKLVEKFDLPFFIALLQNLIVAILSLILVLIFEEINFNKIILETYEILYAGILSGGAAFVLQLFGQRYVPAAPAAIIMSLEGVFATISAWIILNQILGIGNVIGCSLILFGVLFSQLLPLFESKTKNI
tara:strand:- start:4522 stop:5421 length:900 start_codon:yes stop_codon:yes gene_type:complete